MYTLFHLSKLQTLFRLWQRRNELSSRLFQLVSKFLTCQGGVVIAIYWPMIDTAPYVMLLMQTNPLLGASGRGLGPGNRDFFGPCEMASSIRQVPFFGAQKSQDFQGQTYLPLAQVINLPASKAVSTGPNQRSTGSFMYMSFCILFSVFYVLYSVFCILYSVILSLYSVFFVLCFVFCIVQCMLWVLCTWVSGPSLSNGGTQCSWWVGGGGQIFLNEVPPPHISIRPEQWPVQ